MRMARLRVTVRVRVRVSVGVRIRVAVGLLGLKLIGRCVRLTIQPGTLVTMKSCTLQWG